MILTCPRCATRYLIDESHVWSTGRTVQCEACGQRWRATGTGEVPIAPPPPEPVTPEPAPEPAAPFPAFAPVETAGGFAKSPPAIVEPDVEPVVAEEPLVAPSLFRAVPTRLRPTSSREVSPLGRALAILFIVLVVLAGLVLFRDAIVRAVPGVAPVYKSLGLDHVFLFADGAHV